MPQGISDVRLTNGLYLLPFTGSYAQDPDANVTKGYLFCVTSM